MRGAGTFETSAAYDAVVPSLEGSFEIGPWQRSVRSHRPRGDINQNVVRAVAEELARLPDVQATLGFLREGSLPLVPATSLICHPASQHQVGQWQTAIEPAIRAMCKAGEGFARQPVGEGIELLVASIGPPHQPQVVLCVFVDVLRESSALPDMALRIAAAELELWTSGQRDSMKSEGDLAAGLLWQACQGRTLDESCFKLASRLSEVFDDQLVMIGSRKGRRQCQLQGISGIPEFGRSSRLTLAAEALMEEVLIRHESRVVSALSHSVQKTDAEMELLELTDVDHVFSGPLRGSDGSLIGAWIVCIRNGMESTDRGSEVSQKSGLDWSTIILEQADLASISLDAIRRFQPSVVNSSLDGILLKGKAGARRKLLLGGAATLVFLMLPMPYRISCDSTLQPETRRVVSAPYDGILAEVLVQPGDQVELGQVLARMDGREIQWQLAAARAHVKRYGKEHDSAMARGDTGAAQVAELQVQSTLAESKLLKNRLDNLEIRSSIPGIVVGGDPDKLLGSRLSVGQQLFETSPLENMVIQVAIPEADVSHVELGDRVSLRLDAFPHREFHGNIRQISPQAEVRDTENVFVAEVLLSNDRSLLRPGMAGQARISTGFKTLGWILFHRAVDNLRFWMGI